MRERSGASWIVYALGALLAGASVAAVLIVGPASGQQSSQTRVVTARRGVVQSTVSASGNIAAASQLDLGFRTSGTISTIDITQGRHVTQGQLLATLDPQSAEVALEQAKASLQSAEAELAREEETDGESSGSGTSGSTASGSSAGSATAAAASVALAHTAATSAPSTAAPSETTPNTTSTPTIGTPTTTAPATGSSPAGEAPTTQSSEASPTQSSKSEQTQTTKKQAKSKASSGGSSSGSSSTSSSSATSIGSATREASIASAKAAVRSGRLTVKSDEQAVADTRLLAPESGTIVSLSSEVGETVSGGGTSRDTGTSEASSSGSSSATGGAATGATGGSSSSSSGSSSSSSGSFAVLSDLSAMKLVVPLSESEVGSVKAGQTATVTIEALKETKLAAHVSEVAALSTSNSGVVSYDVTFRLDQLQSGLKAGMSATAEVVVARAEGVNVPTSAISAGAVTVVSAGKQERRAVTTGLAGDSTTLILSGLKADEQVVLPLASTSSSSSRLSRLGGSGAATGALGGGLSGAGSGGFARGGLAGGAPGGGGPGG